MLHGCILLPSEKNLTKGQLAVSGLAVLTYNPEAKRVVAGVQVEGPKVERL